MTSRIVSETGVKMVRALAIIGGYGFLVLSLLVAFEVIARKFFAFSLQGIDEIGGYVMAGAVSLGISYTLVHRAIPGSTCSSTGCRRDCDPPFTPLPWYRSQLRRVHGLARHGDAARNHRIPERRQHALADARCGFRSWFGMWD